MKIISAASAFPKHYYPQELLLTALRNYWADELDRPETLDRLHGRACVDGRYLAYPMEEYYKMQTFGDFNRAWVKAAEELGSQALCRALSHAGLDPQAIGAIFFVSVTGMCSPSIDAKLVNRLKLSPNIKRIPSSGWAASPELRASRAQRITFAHIRSRSPCLSRSNCARSPGRRTISR